MQDFLFVKDGIRRTKIRFVDILYIQSVRRYCKIVTLKGNLTIYSSLSSFEKIIPAEYFLRIHKSYIVSLYHTSYFENDVVRVSDRDLPLGRKYRKLIDNKINLLCGQKKNGSDFINKEIKEFIKEIRPN